MVPSACRMLQARRLGIGFIVWRPPLCRHEQFCVVMNAPNLRLARADCVADCGGSMRTGVWPQGLRLAVLLGVLMGLAHPVPAQVKPPNERLENVDRRGGPRPARAGI